MAELGKIEKPEAKDFKEKRKLYVVPTLPFEELAMEFGLETSKIEKFWGEVGDKINYFVSIYGNISVLYIEGIDEDENVTTGFFDKYDKNSSHYKLIKSLLDKGAKVKGIDKSKNLKLSRLLFEEYSRSFLPEVKEVHQGFYGKDIDFDKWREYMVKRIQETQDEMGRLASDIIKENLGEAGNGVLIITDGRPIEFPENTDVFQIRPPAFDEISRTIRQDYLKQ